MSKLGSISMFAGALCGDGAALAADSAKERAIPIFATTPNSGWVLDRSIGVDDLLRLRTADRGPSPSTRPIPTCPTHRESSRPTVLPIFPIRSCRSG